MTMHDLRRQALESHKTVSRKAQSRQSSRASSAANSRVTSRANSRNPSRHASDDEEANLSDDTNWSVNSIDDVLSADQVVDSSDAWKQDLSDRIEEIIDRKRSSTQGRELALASYVHILVSRYAFEEIQSKTLELYPALIKSVKAESSERETCLALRGQYRYYGDPKCWYN